VPHYATRVVRKLPSRDRLARVMLRCGANLLLAVAAVSLFFLGAELVLRVVGREILSTSVLEPHPEMGFIWRRHRKGNVSCVEGLMPISINSLGLRDREYGPKPAGVRRVLVLGDSMAAGYAVRLESTFPKIAEKLLNERNSDSRWEIINGAVPGYSTKQELALLQSIGWQLDPDIAVLAFYLGNDLADNLRDRGPKPTVSRPVDCILPLARDKWDIPLPETVRTWLKVHSAFYVWFENRYDRLLLIAGVRASVPRYEVPSWLSICQKGSRSAHLDMAWQLTRKWIATMSREATGRGTPLGVLVIPAIEQVDEEVLRANIKRFKLHDKNLDTTRPNAEIAAILQELEIPFLDATETLRKQQLAGELTFFKVNAHLTPAGHRIVANTLTDMLETLQPGTVHD